MMHDGGWGMGWGGMGMILFWGVLVLAVAFAVRWVRRQSGDGDARPSPESALDILKRRYARGEISREQYEAMKKDLEP
jgi:putative membrane protein